MPTSQQTLFSHRNKEIFTDEINYADFPSVCYSDPLFATAKKLGAEMKVKVEESATGGGSDGNFTAALGGVGEGAHASNESILAHRPHRRPYRASRQAAAGPIV